METPARDLLTDTDERAFLAAREARIADPLVVPGLAAMTSAVRGWLGGLMPEDRRVLRMAQLQLGLVAFGLSDAFMLMSGLGATPWDVFHQGLARHVGLAVGTLVILVGAAVMLLWIPLRQKPGFGTLSNVVVIGVAMNFTMQCVPTPHALWLRWAVLLSGILINGVATGAYIGAGMGPGPRDGLMTGYAARGHSLRLVRTLIEITVLASGWLLGGTVGVGTALFALAIGPLAHRFIPRFEVRAKAERRGPAVEGGRRVVASAPTLVKVGDC